MTDSDLQQHQKLELHEEKRGVAAANQNSSIARFVNIVYFAFGALEVLLAVRLLLHLIGANTNNGFANLIEGLSAPFVSVFASLIQNPQLGANAVLEVTTLIAMVAYAILAWLIGRVVWLALSRPR